MANFQGGLIRPPRRLPQASSTIPTVTGLVPVPIEKATALPTQMHEENEAGPPPIEANQLTNFAPNEIAIADEATPASPDIAELIGANNFEDDLLRANSQPRNALYAGWREKLTECLSLAYALYLHILLDHEKLKRLFDAPYFSESRERALAKKKEALAALQYVTTPDSEDDRKSASAYATMLIYARHKGITTERFPAEMAAVTLREARAFVRDLPKEKASKREQAPAKPTLTLSYRSEGARRRYVLENVSFSTDNERQSLAERIVKTLHEDQD